MLPLLLHYSMALCPEAAPYQLRLTHCHITSCTLSHFLFQGICFRCDQGALSCNSKGATRCLSQYYLQGRKCKTCSQPFCISCSNKNVCLQCESGFRLQNKQCKECQIRYCMTCDMSRRCLACQIGMQFDADQGICISSDLTFPQPSLFCKVLTLQQKCLNCQTGYYLKGTVCEKCREGCQLCVSFTFCRKCLIGIMRQGACVQSCEVQQYHSEVQNRCRGCPKSCVRCINQRTCLLCSNTWQLDDNCQPICQKGKRLLASQLQVKQLKDGLLHALEKNLFQCKSCLINCRICSSSDCFQCDQQFYLVQGQCLANCPALLSSGDCVPCEQFCQKCTFLTCLNCQKAFSLQADRCVSDYQVFPDKELPGSYYKGCVSEKCSCQAGCKICDVNHLGPGTVCLQCEQKNKKRLKGGCVQQCPEGYLQDSHLMTCSLTCQFYVFGKRCIKRCPSDTIPIFNICLANSCQPGFIDLRNIADRIKSSSPIINYCMPCQTHCQSCIVYNLCLGCQSGFFLIIEGSIQKCVKSCHNYQSILDRKCVNCRTNCQICESSFYFSEGKCLTACPLGSSSDNERICRKSQKILIWANSINFNGVYSYIQDLQVVIYKEHHDSALKKFNMKFRSSEGIDVQNSYFTVHNSVSFYIKKTYLKPGSTLMLNISVTLPNKTISNLTVIKIADQPKAILKIDQGRMTQVKVQVPQWYQTYLNKQIKVTYIKGEVQMVVCYTYQSAGVEGPIFMHFLLPRNSQPHELVVQGNNQISQFNIQVQMTGLKTNQSQQQVNLFDIVEARAVVKQQQLAAYKKEYEDIGTRLLKKQCLLEFVCTSCPSFFSDPAQCLNCVKDVSPKKFSDFQVQEFLNNFNKANRIVNLLILSEIAWKLENSVLLEVSRDVVSLIFNKLEWESDMLDLMLLQTYDRVIAEKLVRGLQVLDAQLLQLPFHLAEKTYQNSDEVLIQYQGISFSIKVFKADYLARNPIIQIRNLTVEFSQPNNPWEIQNSQVVAVMLVHQTTLALLGKKSAVSDAVIVKHIRKDKQTPARIRFNIFLSDEKIILMRFSIQGLFSAQKQDLDPPIPVLDFQFKAQPFYLQAVKFKVSSGSFRWLWALVIVMSCMAWPAVSSLSEESIYTQFIQQQNQRQKESNSIDQYNLDKFTRQNTSGSMQRISLTRSRSIQQDYLFHMLKKPNWLKSFFIVYYLVILEAVYSVLLVALSTADTLYQLPHLNFSFLLKSAFIGNYLVILVQLAIQSGIYLLCLMLKTVCDKKKIILLSMLTFAFIIVFGVQKYLHSQPLSFLVRLFVFFVLPVCSLMIRWILVDRIFWKKRWYQLLRYGMIIQQ